ncbi:MAG TPA: isoprenylcysteine carboxylmethyltransferase family protein [Phycisphaerae bacterium]|nr:isoprenylcysteine carboxylmethyltransferase family protein [Phycisphaerae bacterium]
MSAHAISFEHANLAERQPGRLGGILTLTYGLFSYLTFPATILYAIGFVGNWVVPKSIDSGVAGPVGSALLINAALLGVFVVQHTIMARPAFKHWWTRIVPKPVERSTFVLAASALLGLLFWQWRPMPQVVWSVHGPAAIALSAISLAGWLIAVAASFTISHLDLFGVRQAWLRFRNRAYAPVGFRLAGLYRVVRHPLMTGFLIAFWATPTMTLGHLYFAALVTGYVLFGTWIEERDLIAEHGEQYLAYKREVRGLVPIPKRRSPSPNASISPAAS